MLIIQSYFDNEQNSTINNNYVAARQANLSCKFLKKHGYNVVLYTSENLKDFFSQCGYDDIICISHKETYPNIDFNLFWSGTKLISMLYPKEPFYHIDIDIFLLEDILCEYKNTECLTLHEEPWAYKDIIDNIELDLIASIFNIDLSSEFSVYNAAIFGGQDIDNIQNNINNLLNIVNTINIQTVLKFNETYRR